MNVRVFIGEQLGQYHFGAAHPFGVARYPAFLQEFRDRGLPEKVSLADPQLAHRQDIELFHSRRYVTEVQEKSARGEGFLDYGDTPACKGIYDAATWVAGTTLAAVNQVCAGETQRAFVPIAGLHHARRDRAAGFCVFNDCGIAIEALRRRHGLQKVAYVDIDAHHGDGVFYSFDADPELVFVDFHEDGRYLYPGTGERSENGQEQAKGTKLNIPMAMGSDDAAFRAAWPEAEAFLLDAEPRFIILQCGADSLAGDPLTHLQYSAQTHYWAARRLCAIANQCCEGRIVALGGGGYNLENLAKAWCAVIEALNEP